MARFLAFGAKMLVEVDFISQMRWSENPSLDPAFGTDRTNPSVFFEWKDGTATNYACTAEQWAKLRAFLKAQGMVVEV